MSGPLVAVRYTALVPAKSDMSCTKPCREASDSRELSIDPLNADKIAFAFTAAGAIDAFVVYFWDDLIASIW